MSNHSRDELVYLAKLAEQCERYDGKSHIPTTTTTNQTTAFSFVPPRRARPFLSRSQSAEVEQMVSRRRYWKLGDHLL